MEVLTTDEEIFYFSSVAYVFRGKCIRYLCWNVLYGVLCCIKSLDFSLLCGSFVLNGFTCSQCSVIVEHREWTLLTHNVYHWMVFSQMNSCFHLHAIFYTTTFWVSSTKFCAQHCFPCWTHLNLNLITLTIWSAYRDFFLHETFSIFQWPQLRRFMWQLSQLNEWILDFSGELPRYKTGYVNYI